MSTQRYGKINWSNWEQLRSNQDNERQLDKITPGGFRTCDVMQRIQPWPRWHFSFFSLFDLQPARVHQSPRSSADLKKSKSMLRSIFRLMMVDYCLQMFFSTQQDFEKLTPRSIKLTKDLFKWGKSKSKRTINTALRIASAELTLNPSKGGKRSTSTRKNFVRAKEETAWKLGTYWRSLHPLINATLNNVLPQPPGQSAWIQYSVWVSGSYILFLK